MWVCMLNMYILRSSETSEESLPLLELPTVCLTEMLHTLALNKTSCSALRVLLTHIFPQISFILSSLFFQALSFNCFAAPPTANTFFVLPVTHLPSLPIHQPLSMLNCCTQHFLCSHNALGFEGDVTLSLLTASLSHTITHKYIHTNTLTSKWSQQLLWDECIHFWLHFFPCVINVLSSYLLPLFAVFPLFNFQITCSQRREKATVSVASVCNWVQKWHLAFRSDRLSVICFVFW